MGNYYEILGVSVNASEPEIQAARNNQARKWHPDFFQFQGKDAKVTAEIKIREINEAYKILSNPNRRTRYDSRIGLRLLPAGEAATTQPATTTLPDISYIDAIKAYDLAVLALLGVLGFVIGVIVMFSNSNPGLGAGTQLFAVIVGDLVFTVIGWGFWRFMVRLTFGTAIGRFFVPTPNPNVKRFTLENIKWPQLTVRQLVYVAIGVLLTLLVGNTVVNGLSANWLATHLCDSTNVAIDVVRGIVRVTNSKQTPGQDISVTLSVNGKLYLLDRIGTGRSYESRGTTIEKISLVLVEGLPDRAMTTGQNPVEYCNKELYQR